ncbi:Hypothetical protein PSM36_2485 [Proteiniphilum saccharofermentans]|uniref:Uncharacterized protein n=1 Tax=Proteiniphilum saccharofermentans TaxID=1642647 RepID=A0A1R3T9K3_9BACT|nr:hypothetical protein [Proteiniphilum saccharofermentans]SCD21287.1 Hypothetical protein PSM36_2485 [Proteiniphilum saccharofermentans]SFS93731.1 hypothetical protein SAMN05216365_13214 [Porphyromonadaceae bacterium NLAE-zl-C104]
MKSILYRIQQIADYENVKITALERKIGASKGVLSRAINNGTDIQAKWIQLIVENYPRYNTEWLITGRGEMLRSAPLREEEISDKTVNRLIEEIKQLVTENTMLKIENKTLMDQNDQLIEKLNSGSTLYNFPSITKP